MLLALLALKRARADFAGEVIFTAAADEETGGTLGTRHLLESGIGRGAAFAIVGEPTNLRIDLGNRGVAWLEVRVRGKAGHPGRPTTGVNAVHYAGRLIAALAEMRFDLRNDLFEVPTPSITATMVQGGVKANVIPDSCTITLDRRMLPGETGALAVRQVQEVVDSLPEPGITVEVRCNDAWDPYQISPDEPIVQALAAAHASVLGAPPAMGAKGGATDASHIYYLAGTPTAIYGPGIPATAHTVDEYVDLDQVATAARVYALTALRLLGGDE
jgi:succinyl-diaminopimelate desuccinylase